jgi:hypothetical protein
VSCINDRTIDPLWPARCTPTPAAPTPSPPGWRCWDLPAYLERYAARMATSGAMLSPYLLLADSLAGIRDQLPPVLVRSERMPVDPPDVVEIWFAK